MTPNIYYIIVAMIGVLGSIGTALGWLISLAVKLTKASTKLELKVEELVRGQKIHGKILTKLEDHHTRLAVVETRLDLSESNGNCKDD